MFPIWTPLIPDIKISLFYFVEIISGAQFLVSSPSLLIWRLTVGTVQWPGGAVTCSQLHTIHCTSPPSSAPATLPGKIKKAMDQKRLWKCLFSTKIECQVIKLSPKVIVTEKTSVHRGRIAGGVCWQISPPWQHRGAELVTSIHQWRSLFGDNISGMSHFSGSSPHTCHHHQEQDMTIFWPFLPWFCQFLHN